MFLEYLTHPYLQTVIAIFAFYFITSVAVVFFYMFWTGGMLKLQRVISYVAFFTALCSITLLLYGDSGAGMRSLGAVLALPFTLSARNTLPVMFWLLILLIVVVTRSKSQY